MAGHRTTCMHVRMQACQRPVTAPRPPHITSNHTWLCIIEFPTMLSAASSSIRLATLRSAASSVFSLHTPACASKRASVKMASCCPPSAGPGVSYDYTPKGSFDKISSDLEAYVTGSGSSGRGILLVPDIFGYTQSAKQVLQVADILAAETDSVVVCADYFRGEPWPLSKFPPGPGDDIMGWITAQTWDKLKPDVDAACATAKSQGASKLACIGFCWGVSIAMSAGATGDFVAVGGAHPSLFKQDEALAKAVQCPVILLPAQGDNIDVARKTLSEGPHAEHCVFQDFTDQVHGFLAARGAWDKPEVAAAASKGLGLMAAFLNKHFTA